MAHHHHSHAADITPAERERITAYMTTNPGPHAEQILGELAFYTANHRSQMGLWSMGELDRFCTEYLPSHVGDPALTQAAPDVIVAFAKWLQTSIPKCDVPAIEKRMRKIKAGR